MNDPNIRNFSQKHENFGIKCDLHRNDFIINDKNVLAMQWLHTFECIWKFCFDRIEKCCFLRIYLYITPENVWIILDSFERDYEEDLADAMEESVTEFVVKDNETEMKKTIC